MNAIKLKIGYFNLFLLFLLIVLSSGCVEQHKNTYECINCSVILITLDSLRADHLGAYGYYRNTSPNIDNLAKESYVFLDSISQSGSTVYSLPALLTSKFPISDNITNGFILNEKEVTLAEILKENGYDNYAVISHEFVSAKYGGSQGFKIFDDDYYGYGFADLTAEKAIKMLNSISEKPFFLWIHFREPHAPYNPPEKIFGLFNNETDSDNNTIKSGEDERDYYKKKMEGLYAKNLSDKVNLTEYTLTGKRFYLNGEDIEWLTDAYDANIRFADEQVGILLNELAVLNLTDNTIVIISSDHGESLGEHSIFDHNTLNYGTIHTPLIVHIPKNLGEIKEYPVSNLDIMPTILKIIGINPPSGIRGKYLFDSNRTGYFQFAEYEDSWTIIEDGWKMNAKDISNKDCNIKIDKLFYIFDDPDEIFNLIAENTDRCNYLKNLGHSIKKNYSQTNYTLSERINETIQNASNDTINKLKALGYVN
ncbi:MAG: sulfatase [Candidatus Woesearchaeota archaeon]|nr:sulfatase [Candidatus Woesearchaeota archaeon]